MYFVATEIKNFKWLGFYHVRPNLISYLTLVGRLVIWKGPGLVTNLESPIVVVLSGSMEPAFYRGDLLFLTDPTNELHSSVIDKGNNNHVDGSEPYQGLQWLERDHVVGKIRGFFPHLRYVAIAIGQRLPQLKYALLGGLGRLALVQHE
ncbi:hypothetical protein P691DRAFT_792911 [Macrolepiota fuliginosa MF-IS2]|uniref:Signal peptidase complex catalytic subunit SEC11 n=1 Tax=Macrolepiota fuliginosa MF-IS2 TaxID=1400762 RepID=A0A9P5XD43_9AGAR|nr:hypothetical protein P691DRAFT_792911 [Macrolepiota fuliginosa MF-IS2]